MEDILGYNQWRVLEMNLNYEISDLERKLEKLQVALFEAKQTINYDRECDVYNILHGINRNQTVDSIRKSHKHAWAVTRDKEYQKKVWQEVLKLTVEK